MAGRWSRCAIVFLLLPLFLAGCYLASGERTDTVPTGANGAGELRVQFVSADGRVQREILTGQPVVPVLVRVEMETEAGELAIEILDADLATVMTASARYGLSGEGSIIVHTDGGGRIRYRVLANEARSGTYTIRYRLQEIPTPTPTPTAAPTPAR